MKPLVVLVILMLSIQGNVIASDDPDFDPKYGAWLEKPIVPGSKAFKIKMLRVYVEMFNLGSESKEASDKSEEVKITKLPLPLKGEISLRWIKWQSTSGNDVVGKVTTKGDEFSTKTYYVKYSKKDGNWVIVDSSWVMATAQRNWLDYCATCHGPDGRGDTILGREKKLKDYTDIKINKNLRTMGITHAIEEGVFDGLDGYKMNPYGVKLSEPEIDALADYIFQMAKSPSSKESE